LLAGSPDELVSSFEPIERRARSAVTALRNAGLSDAAIETLRDSVLSRTTSTLNAASGGNPADPAVYGLPSDQVRVAAQAFIAEQGPYASHLARLDAAAPEPPAPATLARLATTWTCVTELFLSHGEDHGDD